ncbi:MAG: LysE family translocator [Muribaculaceae bacterium]|nr:LysE family translocator [Muribaculaceae bacterium]
MESLLASLFYVFWRGLAIGIMISAPMGPVGMLCIQRTLSKGRLTGLYTGIGAAASDLIYCLLTGFGLSFIEDFLTRNQNIIQLLGSGVLIGFAIYLLRKNPVASLSAAAAGDTSSPHKDILGGFLFTFSNPLILFLIVGLFARFNFLDSGLKWYNYVLGYISITAGALGWWWLVTFSVNKVRAHFNVRSMWLINRIIGVVILIFGLVGLVTGLSAIASAQERVPGGNAATGYTLCNFQGAGDAPFVLTWRSSLREGKGPWSLVAYGEKSALTIEFTIIPADRRDPFASGPLLEVRVTDSEGNLIKEGTLDKADTGNGPNRFRLSYESGHWHLTGGNRPGGKGLAFRHDMKVMEVRIIGPEHGVLSIENVDVMLSPERPREAALSPDTLTALADSAADAGDMLAGVWGIYDRTLDETLLRMGGDYRLALLPDSGGWTGYYLSGARICPEKWQPGMVKMRLRRSPFDDRLDAEWHDAEGLPMSRDISAALDEEEQILTILFPYQQSELRLKRLQR